MQKKITDLIPYIGMVNAFLRANREGKLEANRTILGEWTPDKYDNINLKNTLYVGLLGLYNVGITYGVGELLTN
jgi:hypothetical protein